MLISPAKLSVRLGLRPYVVRLALLCGPVEIVHRRGRPLVKAEQFAEALGIRVTCSGRAMGRDLEFGGTSVGFNGSPEPIKKCGDPELWRLRVSDFVPPMRKGAARYEY